MKERSMNAKFKLRFEDELQKLANSIQKKSGLKNQEKIH
jgi:hypothetical protein